MSAYTHTATTCAPASDSLRTTAPRRSSLPLFLSIWAERRALARLSPSQLADLGLSEQVAAREAARPFWDLPKNR